LRGFPRRHLRALELLTLRLTLWAFQQWLPGQAALKRLSTKGAPASLSKHPLLRRLKLAYESFSRAKKHSVPRTVGNSLLNSPGHVWLTGLNKPTKLPKRWEV